MRKMLLVTLIGMALTIYLYGIANKYMTKPVEEVNHIDETTIAVYME